MEFSSGSIWKNANFLKLLISFTITNVGDWFDFYALQIIFSYQWNASALELSYLFIAYLAPSLIFSQFAGILVDRFNRLHLAIITELISGILTFGLLFASTPMWAISIIIARAIVSSINSPVQQTLLRELVSENHLVKAVALNSTFFQLTRVIGPFLGAYLVTYASSKVCISVNIISFFISASILVTVKSITIIPVVLKRKENWFRLWKEGWKIIFLSRLICVCMMMFMIVLLLVMMVESQMALLINTLIPNQPEVLGRVMCMSGIGAIIMGGIFSRKNELNQYINFLVGGTFLIGIGYYVISYFYSVSLLYFAAFIHGLGLGLLVVVYNILMRKEVPQESLGRVMGINGSVQSAVMIIGPIIGGRLVYIFGVAEIFRVVGVICFCAGLIKLLTIRLLHIKWLK